MTDRIILTGIEVFARGGVTDAEKQIGQRYRIDIEMSLDLSAAAATDALEETVSYAEIHDVVVQTMRERALNLVESMAGRIADRLLTRYPADAVTIRVAKLLPPIDGVVASAAVEITRRR